MAQTIESMQAELARVEQAISAAYGGAEFKVQDGETRRELKRQPLDVLLRRKAELELSIDRLSGGSGRGVSHGMPWQ